MPAITSQRLWISVAATALLVGLIGAAAWWLKRTPPPPHVVTRFTYLLPEGQNFTRTGRHVLAISPDGTKLVYVANNQLYLRPMDQLDAQPIPGTNDDPMEPVFSPDSQWIAFFVPATSTGEGTAGWTLKKIAVSGGPSVRLGQLPGAPYGATWRNGMIAFGMNAKDAYGIQAVPEDSGTMRTLVAVDPRTEQATQPQLLDDGAHVLFVVMPVTSTRDEGEVVVQALNGGERRVLVRGGTNPHVLPSGHLVYIHDGTLLAAPFDATRLAVTGTVRIVEGIAETDSSWAGQFAISLNGTLAFRPGTTSNRRVLVWVDRQSHEEPISAPPREYVLPRLSPDGSKIAVDSNDEEHDIWVFDLAKKTLMRLTSGPATEDRPVWTPDGRSLLFAARDRYRVGRGDIFRQKADHTGTPEALTRHGGGGLPWAVSSDGTVIYERLPNPSDLFVLPPGGQTEGRPLLADPKFDEWGAALSPNGHWLAYSSNESGRHEVYVRPFPNVDSGRWQISSDGGSWPRWARSGGELFFVKGALTADVGTTELVAVPVQAGATFTFGTARTLFGSTAYSGFFDVAKDGRFLMLKLVGAASSAPPSIVVVTHWFEEVKARLGQGR